MTLPNDWKQTTLGDVARWGSGGTPKAGTPEYYGGDLPWAVIGDLHDGPVTQTANTITRAGLAASSAKLVPEGAVLVAMYGSIGKLGVTVSPLTTNQAIAFAIPDQHLVEHRFLFYFMMSQRETLAAAGKGATQRNIGQGTLKAWPIGLPPIPEQRRIVEMLEAHLSRLDAADAQLVAGSRRARMAMVASLGEVHRPMAGTRMMTLIALSHGGLFCDGDWVESKDQDPSGTVRLTQLADVGTGVFRDRSDRWMRQDQADRLNCTYLREGDFLIARMPDPLARTCRVPPGLGEAVTAVDVAVLRLMRDDVDPTWLMWAMNSDDFRRRAEDLQSGTTRKRISRTNLATLTLAVPNLEEQRRRVARHTQVVESLERLERAVTRALHAKRRLRKALLAAAFSGRLTRTTSLDEIEEMACV